jgi:indolepyruvate decarboxylase
VNSTAQAYAERCPVVIISGAPNRKDIAEDLLVHHRVGSFDTQMKIFQHITVASACLTEQNAMKEIDRVFEVVKRESMPGYIEIVRNLYVKL